MMIPFSYGQDKIQKGEVDSQLVSDIDFYLFEIGITDETDPETQWKMGLLYLEGKRLMRDIEKGVEWIEKSANQGFAPAQNTLGAIYLSGEIVKNDYKKAIHWLDLAGKKGNSDAQKNLGKIFSDGLGTPQDYVKAHMWFNLSAASGNREAASLRENLANKMIPSQIAEAQKLASEWKVTKDDYQRRWTFQKDMDGDGYLTMKDVGPLVGWFYYYPGDAIIKYIVFHEEAYSRFLTLTPRNYGGILSFFISLGVWVVLFFLVNVILGGAEYLLSKKNTTSR